ncbi:MAG: hypothetical protein JST30_09315 [Armatimonadetes bacterium]|nr:hypothetical protein [Armatimonadota bacterium]
MESKRTRPDAPPLDPRAVAIMKKMAGDFADRYAEEFLLGHVRKSLGSAAGDKKATADCLESPYESLLVFYSHYAFARRGKDRDDLSKLASDALRRLAASTPFEEVLGQADGTALWSAFEQVCADAHKKSGEQQNRGPIQGMLELAQEIHRQDPELSLATWIVDGVEDDGRLEDRHMRIVDIRGVGPKSASTFVRDMVWLYDVEDDIEPADRIFVQPVDRWLRLMVKFVVPEPGLDDPADWIVAGKVSKYTRRAGVSGIGFNMGTTYFGQKIVQNPAKFEGELRELLKASGEA